MDKKDPAINRRLVKAVSHPLRVEILGILSRGGPYSPKQLTEKLNASLGVVSYHLTNVLYEECEVVELVGTRPRRGAVEHFYAAKPGAMIGQPDLQKAVPKLLRHHMAGAALQTFVEQASRSLSAGAVDADDASLITWMTAVVDREGQQKLTTVIEDALEAVAAIEQECAPRIAADPDSEVQMIFSASSFVAVDEEAGDDDAA